MPLILLTAAPRRAPRARLTPIHLSVHPSIYPGVRGHRILTRFLSWPKLQISLPPPLVLTPSVGATNPLVCGLVMTPPLPPHLDERQLKTDGAHPSAASVAEPRDWTLRGRPRRQDHVVAETHTGEE